jgi:type IV secretory pathway VirB10-like protein
MSEIHNEMVSDNQDKTAALPLRPDKQPPLFKIAGLFLLVVVIVIANTFLFHKGNEAHDEKKESEAFETAHANPMTKTPDEATHAGLKTDAAIVQQQGFQQAMAEARAKDFVERLQASQSNGGESSGTAYAMNASGASLSATPPHEFEQRNGVGQPYISDPNTAFLNQESHSRAQHVYAAHFGAMPYLIGQGKFIFANLAVAVNSDLPGQMTAIVSQDVYGEQGRKILIPKGSLLVGEYKSGLVNNQGRLFVVWTRVREPNGIDVMLGSEGTDTLGRAGLTGDVDHHFFARFGSSFLIAMIGAGASTVGVNPNDEYNSAASYRQSVSQALAQQAGTTLNQSINIPPTINVPQGEKIVVFVNRDLDFTRVVR